MHFIGSGHIPLEHTEMLQESPDLIPALLDFSPELLGLAPRLLSIVHVLLSPVQTGAWPPVLVCSCSNLEGIPSGYESVRQTVQQHPGARDWQGLLIVV